MPLCLRGQPALWRAGGGSGNSSRGCWTSDADSSGFTQPDKPQKHSGHFEAESHFYLRVWKCLHGWATLAVYGLLLSSMRVSSSVSSNTSGKWPSSFTLVMCLSAIFALAFLFSTPFLTVLWKNECQYRTKENIKVWTLFITDLQCRTLQKCFWDLQSYFMCAVFGLCFSAHLPLEMHSGRGLEQIYLCAKMRESLSGYVLSFQFLKLKQHVCETISKEPSAAWIFIVMCWLPGQWEMPSLVNFLEGTLTHFRVIDRF